MRLLTRCADPQDVERAVTGAMEAVDELTVALVKQGVSVDPRPCYVLVVSPDDTEKDVVLALLEARASGLERSA